MTISHASHISSFLQRILSIEKSNNERQQWDNSMRTDILYVYFE